MAAVRAPALPKSSIAWGFWATPVCLALIAFVYGASVIGQGLTADEMHAQRRFVERALHEAGETVPGCDF